MASATTTPRSTTISGAREDGGFLDAPGEGRKTRAAASDRS
ncbi:hypothetical protein ACN28S_05785 [Cystobacter fuscus]